MTSHAKHPDFKCQPKMGRHFIGAICCGEQEGNAHIREMIERRAHSDQEEADARLTLDQEVAVVIGRPGRREFIGRKVNRIA
ncbi:hypothetical protein [Novosphingobium sediminicola]|uniref:Uncharacterized protein n=1 Tax=Novosphingobium sediminicola TaxID=563162 RepID=A0A7W6CJY3_9SPHN|nr:hypothetical protein [Novosphingobium sediminicola]MBB3957869.1 hypothetical protein [Novosphingobium sediminicola]